MNDSALFELVDAGLSGPDTNLFTGLSWRVERGRVNALLGPAGVGKSLILRGLAIALPRLYELLEETKRAGQEHQAWRGVERKAIKRGLLT